VDALAQAMREALKPRSQAVIETLDTRYAYLAENFHVDTMVDQIAESYRAIAAAR
jgi:2-phospho-L-lactate transferase/gluconeogenesis factor (CofD/UPF0052 family)